MQKAALRLIHSRLARGWQAWHVRWLAYRARVRLMQSTAGRLMRPGLAAALAHWRHDWAGEQRRLLNEGQQLLRRDQVIREHEERMRQHAVGIKHHTGHADHHQRTSAGDTAHGFSPPPPQDG